jgi:hypothetical protein
LNIKATFNLLGFEKIEIKNTKTSFMKILAKDGRFNVSLLRNSVIFFKPRSIRFMGQNKDL